MSDPKIVCPVDGRPYKRPIFGVDDECRGCGVRIGRWVKGESGYIEHFELDVSPPEFQHRYTDEASAVQYRGRRDRPTM